MLDQPDRFELEVSAVIFQDGDSWCAQCLEYDIVAQADTLNDLQTELQGVLISQFVVSRELGREPFAGIGPAPKRYWNLFEEAKTRVERDDTPLIMPPEARGFHLTPKLRVAA